eukprot:COSAG04_NODE_1193_length_7792_cov_7.972442_1_plen_114_part_10
MAGGDLLAAWPRAVAALLRAARMPENELHAAVGEGRLADLADGLRKKDAEGTLAAGAPCRAPPNSPCPLSPAPGVRGGSAGRAGQPRPHAAALRGVVQAAGGRGGGRRAAARRG